LCAGAIEALSDDLNMPKLLTVLHDLRSQALRSKPAAACLKATAQVVGLLQVTAAQWAAWRPQSFAVDETRVANFIAARNAARRAKNFAEADRIRDELAAMGVVLKDSKDGTTWEIAR
jgi:cysteinyl-tRNA synthetase